MNKTNTSSSYDEYKFARDEVWRILAENEVESLPIDVVKLCENDGIEVYSYSNAEVLIDSLHIVRQCREHEFLLLTPAGRKIILYTDACPVSYRRFIIAVAYAHFILQHIADSDGREWIFHSFREEENVQAGVFATRLLAPLSVLWGMGVDDAKEIERLCVVPNVTAEKRLERLLAIDERNGEWGERTGQGSLFLSSYERAAYRNFSEFIENYRRNGN